PSRSPAQALPASPRRRAERPIHKPIVPSASPRHHSSAAGPSRPARPPRPPRPERAPRPPAPGAPRRPRARRPTAWGATRRWLTLLVLVAAAIILSFGPERIGELIAGVLFVRPPAA